MTEVIKTLEVRGSQIKFDETLTDYIKASVEIRKFSPNTQVDDMQANFKPLSGDYQIDVLLHISKNATLGDFTGQLRVFTNLLGRRKEFPVKLKGSVVSDILVEQEILIFSNGEKKTQVHLGSTVGRDFELLELPKVIGDVDLNVVKTSKSMKVRFSFDVLEKLDESSTNLLNQGELLFNIKDHGTLRVSVIVYQGSQSNSSP